MLAGGAVTTDGTEVLGARQRVSRRVLAGGGAEAGGVAGADGEGRCGHAGEGGKNTVNICLCLGSLSKASHGLKSVAALAENWVCRQSCLTRMLEPSVVHPDASASHLTKH